MKRKRRNGEETPDSPEKKTDEEKSPIAKKTKVKDKKSEKRNDGDRKKQEDIDQDPMENQLLAKCIDCSQTYNTNKTNSEEKCIGCNVGKHDCLKDKNIEMEDVNKTSKGSVWMCINCLEIFQTNIKIVKNDTITKDISNKIVSSKKQLVDSNKKAQNLLEYQGINITLMDIKSLNHEQWVCDTIIALYLAFMNEDPTIHKTKILLVDPSTTFLLKECEEKKVLHDCKVDLKINEMEWIFYPINNNKNSETEGGTHWSLLMFCKKENKYFHFDPIMGKNTQHANKLVLNILDMNNFSVKGLPEYEEVICPQQKKQL